jgi:hypothetical protein
MKHENFGINEINVRNLSEQVRRELRTELEAFEFPLLDVLDDSSEFLQLYLSFFDQSWTLSLWRFGGFRLLEVKKKLVKEQSQLIGTWLAELDSFFYKAKFFHYKRDDLLLIIICNLIDSGVILDLHLR